MNIFIIFWSDVFYIYNDLENARYVVDAISHVYRHSYTEAIEFIVPTISNLFPCFERNKLIPNLGKSCFR